jgi:ATP-dependent Clp protease ATP-binding subunit ClpA
MLRHQYIGTEHILLGLLREDEGLAARVLGSLDVTLEEVRARIGRIGGHGNEVSTGQIPFTPRAKKVLEFSLSQALALGHNYIGTEHVLLGLVVEGQGVACDVLADLGAPRERVWEELLRLLGMDEPPALPPPKGSSHDADVYVGFDAEDRWEWLYALGPIPSVIAGAALLAGGLLIGWLIWG